MSGLLGALGGLGQGVAQVGQQGLQSIQREEELARQLDLEEWRMKKREQFEIDKDERKSKKLVDDTIKANERTDAIGDDRRFAAFKSKLGQTDATDEELRAAFNQEYNNKNLVVDGKLDTSFVDKGSSARAGDFLKATQETGNSGLISTALKGVDDARASDKLQQDKEIAERNASITEANNKSRHEELMARLGKSDGKTDPTIRLTLNSQLNSANHEIDRLSKEWIEFSNNPRKSNSKDPEVIAEGKEIKSRLASARKMRDDLDAELTLLRTGGKPSVSTPVAKEPQGKAYDGVNPDGSVRYKPASNAVPDITPADVGRARGSMKLLPGETDAKQILLDEYKKAVASGNQSDIAAVASELKRLGVNVSNEPSQSNPSGGQSNRIVSIKRVG